MENKDIVQEVIKEMKELDAECSKYNETEESREKNSYKIDQIKYFYDNMPTVLRDNREIAIEALKSKNIDGPGFIGLRKFSDDKEIAKLAISEYWDFDQCFNSNIFDKDFVLELAKTGAWLGPANEGIVVRLKNNDPDAFKDNNYIRELLKYPGTSAFLKESSDELKNDKDLVISVLKNADPIDYHMERGVGDRLLLDPDVQKAFAEALIADEEEEAYWYLRDMKENYEYLSDDEREFAKRVVATEGFVDRILKMRDEDATEELQKLTNKIKQNDLIKADTASRGTSR